MTIRTIGIRPIRELGSAGVSAPFSWAKRINAYSMKELPARLFGTCQKSILKSCSQAGKADYAKLAEAVLLDGLADIGHEPVIVGHVVQREQRRPQHFVRQEQMVQ